MNIQDVENAAREASNERFPIPELFRQRLRKQDFEYGFYAGSSWRINSIWKNDIVKADRNKAILVKFKNGLFRLFDDIRELKGIEDEVYMYAYISDLECNVED